MQSLTCWGERKVPLLHPALPELLLWPKSPEAAWKPQNCPPGCLGEETETWAALVSCLVIWLVGGGPAGALCTYQAVCHVTTWSSQKGKPSSPLAITPSWKYDCLDFSPIFCMTSNPIGHKAGWGERNLVQSRRGWGSLLLFYVILS